MAVGFFCHYFGKYFVVIFVTLCLCHTISAKGSEEEDTGSMEIVSSVHHAKPDENAKPSEKQAKKTEEGPVIGGASLWRSPYDSHMIGNAQEMRYGYIYQLNDDPKVGASYNGVPIHHYNSKLDEDIKNFGPSFRSWDENMAAYNDVDPKASLGKAPPKSMQKDTATLPARDMSHLEIIAKAREMGANAPKDIPKTTPEKREKPKTAPVVGQAPAIPAPVVDITNLPRMSSYRTCGGVIAFRQMPEQLPQQFYRQQPQQQFPVPTHMMRTSDQSTSFDGQKQNFPVQPVPNHEVNDQGQADMQRDDLAKSRQQSMMSPAQQMPTQPLQVMDQRQMSPEQPQQPTTDQRQMPQQQQQPMFAPAEQMPFPAPVRQFSQQGQQVPAINQRQMMLMPGQQMPTQQRFDQRQMSQQQPMLTPTQQMPSQVPTQQLFDHRQMPQQQPMITPTQQRQTPSMSIQNQQDQRQMPQQPMFAADQQMPMLTPPQQSPGQQQQLWGIEGRQANPENTKTNADQKLQGNDANESPAKSLDASTDPEQRLSTQEGPVVQPAALQQDLSKSEKMPAQQVPGWEQDPPQHDMKKLDVQMRTQEGEASPKIDEVKLDEMKAVMEEMPKVGNPHFFKKQSKHHSTVYVLPGVYGGYAGGYARPSYAHYHYHTPSYGGYSHGHSYGIPSYGHYGHHGHHAAGLHHSYGGYVGLQNPLENDGSTTFPEPGAPVDKVPNSRK